MAPTPRAALASGPSPVFLSRDGGTRTRDLSIPNAAGPDWCGLLWTETAGQGGSRTAADRPKRLRTRDGRAMEIGLLRRLVVASSS